LTRVRIGTCSWTDKPLLASGWYPSEVKKEPEALLRYYSSQFDLVEVDSTYYAIPLPRNAELWVERTPEDFIFDVKAFRLFTLHQTQSRVFSKDIQAAMPPSNRKSFFYADIPSELREELWRQFRESIRPLEEARKLGVVLLQFPPWAVPSSANENHIRDCVEHLQGLQVAVEFRHRDWLRGDRLERTIGFLEENQLAFVAVDAPRGFETSMPGITTATAPTTLVAVRLLVQR